MYFLSSNVVFKMKRVVIHMKNMGKNYLIWILSNEMKAIIFSAQMIWAILVFCFTLIMETQLILLFQKGQIYR